MILLGLVMYIFVFLDISIFNVIALTLIPICSHATNTSFSWNQSHTSTTPYDIVIIYISVWKGPLLFSALALLYLLSLELVLFKQKEGHKELTPQLLEIRRHLNTIMFSFDSEEWFNKWNEITCLFSPQLLHYNMTGNLSRFAWWALHSYISVP